MKLGKVLIAALLSAAAAMGCSRNRQEAVILANEGDKVVKSNVDVAIEKYDQASRLDATNHHIMFKLAMAYKRKEAWDKMASTLAQAVQIAPEWAVYWAERGFAIEQQAKDGKVEWIDAKEPYDKCIETDPHYAECYRHLGNVYLWTGDEQKALENYTKAIEHNPHKVNFYTSLADLYIRLLYIDEAQQVLNEAKKFAKPDDTDLYDVHVLLAKVYQDKKMPNEQIAELEAAKKLATEAEAVEILFNLGSSYATLEDPKEQEAIQMLKGFHVRACKGNKAETYAVQCQTASSLVAKLGGSLQ